MLINDLISDKRALRPVYVEYEHVEHWSSKNTLQNFF